MRIYKMQATFGKLENRVLELQPGLNIIQAPNEWGKSTWCAFLVAMLYGIETRARSTQTALAEKEKYAPWSGSPMEGKIELRWADRDITIERRTVGRTPLGGFRAYETATGLAVPELTASNCGQMLLGVERSVFVRAGFLRLSDLPVTQDEALRRRLNALVTTGDESCAAEMLAAKLKELKNSCRYNRTGLLPRAEAELDALEKQRTQLKLLRRQAEECSGRAARTQARLEQLKNHMAALEYREALADAERVRGAEAAVEKAKETVKDLEQCCAGLPRREEALRLLDRAETLEAQWTALQRDGQRLPWVPEMPEGAEVFRGGGEAALEDKARVDADRYERLRREARKKPVLPWVLLALGSVLGVLCAWLKFWPGMAAGAAGMIAGGALLGAAQKKRASAAAEAGTLAAAYPWPEPERWVTEARNYAERACRYRQQKDIYRSARDQWNKRLTALEAEIHSFTRGEDLRTVREQAQQTLEAWSALEQARLAGQQAERYLRDIAAMAKTAAAPAFWDELTITREETEGLIGEQTALLHRLRLQQGKLQGEMSHLGDEQALHSRIEGLAERIALLKQTEAALEIGQQTLSAATAQLQRRFAPRIAERARTLFSQLTDGRYDRLSLTRELTVDAAAAGEITLHPAQWRSEGTVDQMYLALRLAVAEALTPEAPLILDDALVRFDDARLGNAMEELKQEALARQVILFTCQDREQRWLARQNGQ